MHESNQLHPWSKSQFTVCTIYVSNGPPTPWIPNGSKGQKVKEDNLKRSEQINSSRVQLTKEVKINPTHACRHVEDIQNNFT